MEELKNSILHCNKCNLSKTRNNPIFGEGNLNAPIFIIGEAPGKDEDLLGRPFIGKSGQLLDKILTVCGFTREEHVFISNIVRCRPPENRIPTTQEAEICMPYLLKQIELVNPKILILLGATALKYMAGQNHRITKEHGTWLTVLNKLAMPVYHPAALLRDPSLKKDTWEDFKKIVFKYRELINPQHYSPHI
ncbi:MAG: uracil-DNA glycosylase family protein [Bacteroidales bacterium]